MAKYSQGFGFKSSNLYKKNTSIYQRKRKTNIRDPKRKRKSLKISVLNRFRIIYAEMSEMREGEPLNVGPCV